MVQPEPAAVGEHARPASDPVFVPYHPQRWELASLLLGLPGGLALGLATVVSVFVGVRDQSMLAWGVLGTLWTVYLCGMAVLWMGTAAENAGPPVRRSG